MNVGNTIVGSGIIGLPYALKEAGFVLGILLLLLVSSLTMFSLRVLIINGIQTKKFHYPDLFEFCFGKAGFYIVNLILLINSGGGCITYFSKICLPLFPYCWPHIPLISFFVSHCW